jgi:hypothetical protein
MLLQGIAGKQHIRAMYIATAFFFWKEKQQHIFLKHRHVHCNARCTGAKNRPSRRVS